MSITPQEIEQLIKDNMEGSQDFQVKVEGGDGKYMVRVVSQAFEGLNAVKRQQAIYRILNPHIASGAIHAVSMDLLTPAEQAGRQ